MSIRENQELYEDLIVWLGERGFKSKDIHKDKLGYFVFGRKKKSEVNLLLPLYLPDIYQQLLC